MANLSHRAMEVTVRTHLGMAISRRLMGSQVPMLARGKQQTAMGSKAPMVAKGKEVAAMEDGVKVKVVVRVGGSDVTKETVQKEGPTEAEAVVVMTVVVMIVAVMTAVDTTVAEEVDLLVWGKLHSATAPKVPLYTLKYET